jgi:hypothetical protein
MINILRKSALSRRPTPRRWPRFESLERRDTPATFAPNATAVDGATDSLRAAVIAANSNGQDNTITLQAAVYPLTIANKGGQENGAAEGDLDLTGANHTLTLEGAGTARTTIDAGKLDRVFQVFKDVTVVLRNLTLRNGRTQDGGVVGIPVTGTPGLGGGILNAGKLTLDQVVVTDCAAFGNNGADGVSIGTSAAFGQSGTLGAGGGIENVGTLTLIQSTIKDCIAVGGNGGMGAPGLLQDGSGGRGGGGHGGGVESFGSLTIVQSTLSGNRAFGGNGGKGAVKFHDNGFAGGNGGEARGGGLFLAPGLGQATLMNTTIAANSVAGGVGAQGGDGDSTGAAPGVGDGTQGGTGGNGGFGLGGGVYTEQAVILANSTVALNEAHGGLAGPGGVPGVGATIGFPGADGHRGVANAGGIRTIIQTPTDNAALTSLSSLIAGNMDDTSTFPDMQGTFASVSNTLLQDVDGATGITGGKSGNIVGQDPRLGPLQDNGGPTATIALLAGSPAINAGANPLNLTVDQRGFSTRAVGGSADIGAFETGATAPPPGGGPGGGGSGSGSGSGAVTVQHITVAIVKQKRRRLLAIRDAATGTLKFNETLGGRFRGKVNVTTRDVNHDNFDDAIVQAPGGKKKPGPVRVFSGKDGSVLPSSLA